MKNKMQRTVEILKATGNVLMTMATLLAAIQYFITVLKGDEA